MTQKKVEDGVLELLLDKEPNEFIIKSVWAANSRYYVDGKSIAMAGREKWKNDNAKFCVVGKRGV